MELEQLVEFIKCIEIKNKPKEKYPLCIGKKYFIRAVTIRYTGRLVSIKNGFLELENASWITDTGRFHDFLRDGKCNKYESFIDNVFIPVSSLIDITEWKHRLFNGQK